MDDIIDGEAADDDPEVVAGMARLAAIRSDEAGIPEIWKNADQKYVNL